MNALNTRVTNTKKGGIVRFVYITNSNGCFGICLDFNIIEEGKNEAEVYKNLETAVQLHIDTVKKNNLSDDLLNRLAPKEYWDIYDDFHTKNALRRKGKTSLKAEEYTSEGALSFAR
jgi:hypothetical protein